MTPLHSMPTRDSQKPNPERKIARRLELRVQKTIAQHAMIRQGDHVLLALSGGADSTALLYCLHALAHSFPFTLTAAHLNHCIRGREADEDAAFVEQICASLLVPVVVEASEVPLRARLLKKNLEETAREERLAFLERTARLVRATKIALAHNRNDQAETVLMRLLRGSGIEGLAAMDPVRDAVFIRPFLEIERAEIEAYLHALRIPWREDSTNQSLDYRRNRVRRELLPYLQQHFNPKLLEALARHARLSREIADLMATIGAESLAALCSKVEGGLVLDADRLRRLHPALQKTVLRLAIKELRGSLRGFTGRHMDSILALTAPQRSGRRLVLPGGLAALRQFRDLLLQRIEAAPPRKYSYELAIPGRVEIPEAGLEVAAYIEEGQMAPARTDLNPFRIYLQADLVPDRLFVRSRLPGDRYGGPYSKKVKKLLIDMRVPLRARASLPMVASEGQVLWIPGFAPPRRFAAHGTTSRCVVLVASPCRPTLSEQQLTGLGRTHQH